MYAILSYYAPNRGTFLLWDIASTNFMPTCLPAALPRAASSKFHMGKFGGRGKAPLVNNSEPPSTPVITSYSIHYTKLYEPPALEEAISCLGGGLGAVLRDAVLPFIATTAVSVFFFLFMRSMVTLSAVIFLTTPRLSVAARNNFV